MGEEGGNSSKCQVVLDYIVCSRVAWAIDLRLYLTRKVKRDRGSQDQPQIRVGDGEGRGRRGKELPRQAPSLVSRAYPLWGLLRPGS